MVKPDSQGQSYFPLLQNRTQTILKILRPFTIKRSRKQYYLRLIKVIEKPEFICLRGDSMRIYSLLLFTIFLRVLLDIKHLTNIPLIGNYSRLYRI